MDAWMKRQVNGRLESPSLPEVRLGLGVGEEGLVGL